MSECKDLRAAFSVSLFSSLKLSPTPPLKSISNSSQHSSLKTILKYQCAGLSGAATAFSISLQYESETNCPKAIFEQIKIELINKKILKPPFILLRKNLDHLFDRFRQFFDFVARVVKRERSARRCRNVEKLHDRLRAVMTGADGDA